MLGALVLVLVLVVVCDGVGDDGNRRSGVSAAVIGGVGVGPAIIGDVGALAVPLAIGFVCIEGAGGVDEAGGIVRADVAGAIVGDAGVGAAVNVADVGSAVKVAVAADVAPASSVLFLSKCGVGRCS
jgi:hypothetical protein